MMDDGLYDRRSDATSSGSSTFRYLYIRVYRYIAPSLTFKTLTFKKVISHQKRRE